MRDLKVPDLAVIDGFVVDCLISDTHNFPSEVTDFEVESGSTISDNIRNKPIVVTMDVLVSDTPIGAARNFRHGDPTTSSDDCYDVLIKMRDARDVVSISTSLRTYDNMACESLSIPRSSEYGDGSLRFTATFKQITFKNVDRETRVAIPGAQGAGGKTSTATPVANNDNGVRWIDISDLTWYDRQIVGWRHTAKYDAQFGSSTIGRWLLTRGKPVDVIQAQWDKMTPAQQRDQEALRKLIIKNTGRVPPSQRPNGQFLDDGVDLQGRTGHGVAVYSPGQYIELF